MNEGGLTRSLFIAIGVAAIFVAAVFLYYYSNLPFSGRSETSKEIYETQPLVGSRTISPCSPKNPYEDMKEALTEPGLVCVLDLSLQELETLPVEIENFINLKRLIVANNLISGFPSEIGNISELEVLDARGNLLTFLPKEVGNLKKLRELNVTNNRLSYFPKEIGNMTSLAILKAFNNEISELPSEIGDLTKLRHLSLHDNLLTSLPESIRQLLSLEEIILGNNNFSESERDKIRVLLPNAAVSFGTSPHPER